MNTISNIIWNHATQSFVEASELAKGRTKSSIRSSGRVFNLTRIGATMSLVLGSSAVMAGVPVTGNNGSTCVVDGITVACANGAQAITEGSIAIGGNAQAKAQDSIAQGTGAIAYDDKTIAIGNGAVAGHNGPALGWWKHLINPETQARFGSQQELTDYLAKVGDNKEDEVYKQVHGFESIAVGHGAYSTGHRTVAVGRGAEATIRAWSSVAVGDNASANASNAVIIGHDAFGHFNGRDSVAIGYRSEVRDHSAVAIGYEAIAGAISSTAIGRLSLANAIGATALGREAKAEAHFSSALGGQSTTIAKSSIALGQGSVADRVGFAVANDSSKADMPEAVSNPSLGTSVLPGSSVKVKFADQVYVLDNVNEADKMAVQKTVKRRHDLAQTGAISVGNSGATRQIINVAAGSIDTDAVNVAQLKAVAKTGMKYVGDKLDPSVEQKNGELTNEFVRVLGQKTSVLGGAEGDLTDKNIGVVSNGQDTLTVKLAKELKGLDSITFGDVDPDTGKLIDPKTGKPYEDGKAPENNVSIGKDGINTGNKPINNINNGLNTYDDSNAPKNGLVNLDNSDVKDNTAATVGDLRDMGWIVSAKDYTEQVKNANQVNFVGTGAAKVTGETKDGVRTITIDVKAPEADGMNSFGVTANDDNPTTITEGNKVNFIDGNNAKVTITPKADKSGVDVKVDLADNITAGKNGKDGVDGSIGATGKDGASAVLNGKDGSIDLTGVKGADGKDGVSASISVKDGSKGLDGNDGKDGASKTRVVYTRPDGSQEEVATLNDGMKFAGNKGDVLDKKLNETVTIKGDLANDKETTAVNTRVDVENGELIIKMAKMLKDLEGAEFKDKDGNTVVVRDGGIVLKGKDSTDDSVDSPKNISLTQNGLNNGGNKITNVGRGTDKTDAVNVEQLEEVKTSVGAGGFNVATNGEGAKKISNGDTVDFVNGNNTVVSKVDGAKGTKVKVDLAKNLKGLNSVKLKDQAGNTTTMTGNGVNIIGTNAAGKPSNVSLTANGLNNGGNRITNVAPGVKGTDAVNVNQLNAVGNRIGDVDRKARGGIAGSTAMANLPQAYIPGHSMVAVAAGTHRGANAVAVGVSRISDSGHVIIKLSGSTDSKGGTNAGVGVGYQW